MRQNVCSPVERTVRWIIGLAVLSLVYFLRDEGAVRYVGLIGLIFIGTAVVKYCPISHVFGFSSCKPKHV